MGKGSKKKRTGSKPKAMVETKPTAKATKAETTVKAEVKTVTKPKDNTASINKYLDMLKKATERHEKCRLRAQLRRLGHRGGLRARTWHDADNTEHIVEKKTA